MYIHALVTRVVRGYLICRCVYIHVYVYMYTYIHTHTDKRNAQHANWSTTCSPIGHRCNTCHNHTTPRRRSAPRTLRPARLAPLATHTYTHQHTHTHGHGGCMRWRARWRVRISILLKVPRTVHVEVGGEGWRGRGVRGREGGVFTREVWMVWVLVSVLPSEETGGEGERRRGGNRGCWLRWVLNWWRCIRDACLFCAGCVAPLGGNALLFWAECFAVHVMSVYHEELPSQSWKGVFPLFEVSRAACSA